jgi:hypothetical protein
LDQNARNRARVLVSYRAFSHGWAFWPWLLDRLNYLTDPAYAGRFDPNPMHMPIVAE